MSTHLNDKVEKIEHFITKLIEESEKGKPIIVEGKNDVQTLQELGVNGTILTVKTGGKSFLEAISEIEELGYHEVILLLDFDRRGTEGTKRLTDGLEHGKIKVNLDYWRELRGIVSREILCIESLISYLHTLKSKL